MANTIGTAYVQIEPTTKGIGGSLSNILDGEAEKAGASAGGKLSSALGGALKVGVGAVAGLTTAVAGAGTALTSAASGVAQYGDNIDKMSQKLGVSSDFYQEWDAVLQHSGTSMDSMSATFKKLATTSQDATDSQKAAYERLGLSMEQVSSMSTEDLFSSVITGLQGMEEGTERTALATELLGRGAMEMGALLNTSSEDTQEMIARVNQLGGVLDEKGVKASAAFQDSLQDMQTSFAGLKNGAMAEILPFFTEVIDGITALLQGDLDDAFEHFTSGFDGIAKGITEKLPQITEAFTGIVEVIAEVAPEIINSLATGIIDSVPRLLPTIVNLVLELGKMIIENLPKLIEAGLKVILELANGIAESLPELIPTIVDVVLEITDTLIDNVDLLIDGAIALIIGLAEGLINAMPRLIEKIPEIVIKIGDAIIRNAPKLLSAALELIVTLAKGIISNIPKLLETVPKMITGLVNQFKSGLQAMISIGSDLVNGIKQGISKAWDNLTEWLGNLCGKLVDKVKNALKIGSPSKVFRDEVGRWIPEGVAVGIDANADSINDAINGMTSDAVVAANGFVKSSSFNPSVSASNYDNTDNSVDLIEQLGNRIEDALHSVGVFMDGRAVGTLVASSVNAELGRINVRRV